MMNAAADVLTQGLKNGDLSQAFKNAANGTVQDQPVVPDPDPTPVAPPPPQPAGAVDLGHFDMTAFVPQAQAQAARVLKHPQLVMETILNVGPDGKANLTQGSATYMFAEGGGGKPCSLIVNVSQVGVNAMPQDTCLPQKPVHPPTCTLARVAKKMGVTAGKKADSLTYMDLGSLGAKWSGTVGGEAKLVDDDCD
jgi:hypothetical protein